MLQVDPVQSYLNLKIGLPLPVLKARSSGIIIIIYLALKSLACAGGYLIFAQIVDSNCALNWRYFTQIWNIFDFTILLFSITGNRAVVSFG